MRPRNSDIEALRAIAIVLTVLQHVHVLMPRPEPWVAAIGKHVGFWPGVDLFFVVSGFVITGTLGGLIHRKPDASPWREAGAFWVKRAFRLLPTAWLGLLLGAATAWLAGTPPVRVLWQGSLAAVLNASNVYFAWCITRTETERGCDALRVIGHYWSLSLEEQFYILWPLALIFVPRRFVPWLAGAGIAAGWFVARNVFTYGWYLRVDGFLWGILLAWFAGSAVLRRIEPRLLARAPVRFAILALLLLALIRMPAAYAGLGVDFSGAPRSWATSAITALCAVFVWIASYDRGYIAGNGALARALGWLGARSYALYVIHWPVFNAVSRVLERTAGELPAAALDALALLLGVSLSVALAHWSLRFVETPLRLRGRRIAERIHRREESPAPA